MTDNQREEALIYLWTRDAGIAPENIEAYVAERLPMGVSTKYSDLDRITAVRSTIWKRKKGEREARRMFNPWRWFSKLLDLSRSAMLTRGMGEGITVDPGKPGHNPFTEMRPFNIELYAKNAEEALRRIWVATSVGEDDLRAIANEELQVLKKRYRHNGYLRMQPDQKAVQAQEECVCTAPPPQPCGPRCEYPYTDCCGTTAACCRTGESPKWVGPE